MDEVLADNDGPVLPWILGFIADLLPAFLPLVFKQMLLVICVPPIWVYRKIVGR
jgi:hypothetical protein